MLNALRLGEMSIIKVILFPINKNEDAEERDINNSLKSLYQTICCNTIEIMSLPDDYVLIFDEYGRINNSQTNECIKKYIKNPKFTELQGKVLLCKKINNTGEFSNIDGDILNKLPSIISQHVSNWIKMKLY